VLAQLKRNRHPPRGGPLLVVSSRSGGRGRLRPSEPPYRSAAAARWV